MPFGNNQGQPFNEGIMTFAGWIVGCVLVFFILAVALDFIQARVDPSSNEKSGGAAQYFGKVDKRDLVKTVVGQKKSREDY